MIMHHATGTSAIRLRAARTTRRRRLLCTATGAVLFCFLMLSFSGSGYKARAQSSPFMLDSNLLVGAVVTGLITPTSMAFPASNEIFVLEKNTGKVMHLVMGSMGSLNTVLDLAVNNSSERGLLGIALDPQFAVNHFVYLYWTCQAAPPPPDNPFFPTAITCPDTPQLGGDSSNILAVPLLGNRVDRFIWNGTSLTWDRNLIKLRSFQNDGAPVPPNQGDAAQPPAGNHNGGVIRFGPDGKLYIIMGDNGRRGQLQNLPSGPTETGLGPTVPDDQFGGPQPDNAHFTGVVIRLNSDGTTPTDNPFFAAGAAIGGEVGSNIQKIFAYGVRNSFGLAFDPLSGNLWDEQNGDDSFDELNLVEPGQNGGWVQIMGPVSRISEYKQIETTLEEMTLQQLRWPPTRIANTPQEALSRLFMLPGAHYSDPDFSWKFALAPAGIGFLNSQALGPQYFGDLFIGFAEAEPLDGPLFRFHLAANRTDFAFTDSRLADHVADNVEKHDLTESESLLIGENFGIVTDIQTGPNGHLFVVSLSNGAIYEIFPRPRRGGSR
jgi:glucose/arabinose dehydrogenase